MNDETKQNIRLHLQILKGGLQKEGVSIGFNKTDDKLFFFDTGLYIEKGKFDGFSVSLNDLV